MRRIRVQYSTVGKRWAVDVLGTEGIDVESDVQGDVTILRDGRGRVTSMVIDAERLEPDVLQLVERHFGTAIAGMIEGSTDGEFDEVFIMDDEPGSAMVRRADQRVGTPIVLLPGEPGVPVPIEVGRFRIVVNVGSETAEGLLEHDRAGSWLRISLPGNHEGETLWVRVADGETGALLALAPLGKSSDRSMSGEMAFGLSVPMQSLHFSTSEEPLSKTGDRTDRRRQWASDLEARATGSRRRLRSDAAKLLDAAADVHEAAGDRESADRCRSKAKRIRRLRRVVFRSTASVMVVAIGLLGFFVGNRDNGDERLADAAMAAAPSTTSSTLVTVPPNPGPVDLDLGDGKKAQVFVKGDAIVAPGETIEVVIVSQLVDRYGFNRLIDCRTAERGVTFGFGDGPLYAPTFLPRLESITDPGASPRVFSPFTVERKSEASFVLPGECEAKSKADGELFEVDAVAVFTPSTLEITLPDDLEPGSWRLRLILESKDGASVSGDYVTIGVAE